MFKKILFSTTVSQVCSDAADFTFDMAKKFGSELYVYHVFGFPTHGFSPYVIDFASGDKVEFSQEHVAWMTEEVKNAYADQLERYDNVNIQCSTGTPYSQILRKARREEVDLIVLGSHLQVMDADAISFRNIPGGTLQRVTQSAHCPVLIISRPCDKNFWEFKNVVFGTDFSKAADKAFRYALKIAQAANSKLHIFHSVDLDKHRFKRFPSQVSVETEVQKARERIGQIYGPKLKGYDNFNLEIWEGTPYVEILKYARNAEADLIVMAHHTHERDETDLALGSTIEEVVLRSQCPVASVNQIYKY